MHKSQYEILKEINIPSKYKNYKWIRWLYMTLAENMRDEVFRNKYGGCGRIHECPDNTCKKLGCYTHMPMDNPNYNYSKIKYKMVCNCGYGLGWNDKIGLKSCFQGAIGSYLCTGSSLPAFSFNNVKFMRENLCKS